MYIPAVADTVPLFFIATQEDKLQSDGINTALGTVESNVVRTITSLTQSLQVYGIPSFLKAANGSPLHGSALNEYGLYTLNRYLGIGDLAYVIRANVNLQDNYTVISSRWALKVATAAAELTALSDAYLASYNMQNGYNVGDVGFRDTVSNAELLTFTQQVMQPIFSENTFARAEFDFYDDSATPALTTAGFQGIDFTAGLTTPTLPTGLNNNASVYTASIVVNGVPRLISLIGANAQNFTNLLIQVNADLAGTANIAIVGGNLVVTSTAVGSLSSIVINDTNLFSSLNGYNSLGVPIAGATADTSIDVYANGFNQPYTTQYMGYNGAITAWALAGPGTGSVASEWTPAEAGAFLIDAATEYNQTIIFANNTTLGATDAIKRASIVTALQAVVNSNQEIRSELFEYNIIICPGFPELADDLLTLCEDIGEEAMVIGEVPFNLTPEQAANWGNAPATSASSRRVHRQIAYYYPHGMGTNVDGADVFVPASAIALRTYTYNDAKAELWFAPAGVHRGQVTGITRIGHVTGTLGGPTTFVDIALNKGQRNALYQYYTNINPIANMPGRGMLVFGQKTSQSYASALDRVNVVRLCAYIRRQARKLGFSYLFEPNDQITRNNFKSAIEGMLKDILVKRGLVDYIVVCDTSNNYGIRIDRHELYLDIAIKPMLAVEFIIIPVHVVAQGAEMIVNT
jgi:phage tail sheath protein FI